MNDSLKVGRLSMQIFKDAVGTFRWNMTDAEGKVYGPSKPYESQSEAYADIVTTAKRALNKCEKGR